LVAKAAKEQQDAQDFTAMLTIRGIINEKNSIFGSCKKQRNITIK
tara:strand:- start:1318 stop:1452 length:135 start_codon:yes stop_codon:yes gene_type:complete